MARSRSPRWSLFRTMTLRNSDGTPYLKRWRIFECPWFGVYLHRISGPDEGRDLHDHPWPFVSIVLRGGYHEEAPFGASSPIIFLEDRCVRWVNAKRAESLHRVCWLHRVPTWTLILRGPRCRDWGFVTEDGWVRHDQYHVGAIVEEAGKEYR